MCMCIYVYVYVCIHIIMIIIIVIIIIISSSSSSVSSMCIDVGRELWKSICSVTCAIPLISGCSILDPTAIFTNAPFV